MRQVSEAGEVSKPTCRELLDGLEYVGYRKELVSRVERVLALHKPTSEIQMVGTGMTGPSCIACFPAPWPCPTVRALNGEEQTVSVASVFGAASDRLDDLAAADEEEP